MIGGDYYCIRSNLTHNIVQTHHYEFLHKEKLRPLSYLRERF